MNFLDQHAGNENNGQDLCPMNEWSFVDGYLKVEQEHVGEEQQKTAVEDLESDVMDIVSHVRRLTHDVAYFTHGD